MDTKSLLEEAARHGKLSVLHNLLNNNPEALVDFRLKSPGESLLHKAIKCEQLSIVVELIKRDRNAVAVKEMDKDGFRALDIAVIMGNMQIVGEILNFDNNLVLLKGKDGRTALHHAAVRGRPDIIDALLNSCPELIEDLTVHAETALHLAVKNHQFDAFTALIKWVERLSKESIMNVADEDGNTALHVAVFTKQYACVDLVLAKSKGKIDVNSRNVDGLTVLDVVDIQDSYDLKISHKLENVGAVGSPGSHPTEKSMKLAKNLQPKQDPDPNSEEDWFKYFKFQKKRDSPSDARNALLVVAALIATISFQAGLDPFTRKNSQPSSLPSPRSSPTPAPTPGDVPAPGLSASQATLLMFLFANSLGFMASLSIISYLSSGFPFQRELFMAIGSMSFAYSFGINAILDDELTVFKTRSNVLMTVAFILPYLLRWPPRWGKRAWIRWRNRDSRNTLTSSI